MSDPIRLSTEVWESIFAKWRRDLLCHPGKIVISPEGLDRLYEHNAALLSEVDRLTKESEKLKDANKKQPQICAFCGEEDATLHCEHCDKHFCSQCDTTPQPWTDVDLCPECCKAELAGRKKMATQNTPKP